MKIVTVEEMRAMERAADESGLTYEQMMENAGRSVADAILERWPDPRQVIVLCGPGNNGGDALVTARYLAQQGWPVRAYAVKRSAEGDVQRERAVSAGVSVADESADDGHETLIAWLREADLIIDGLLGTGARPPLRSPIQDVLALTREIVESRRAERGIEASPRLAPVMAMPGPVKAAPRPAVVAVDCPSGMDCDTGELPDEALSADVTVTFACPKRGHFLFPGAGATGELLVADIGIPESLAESVAVELATPAAMRRLLPPRPRHAHKGTFGRALIVAGSLHFTGAAYLAGAAATRVGAGLVTMAVPRAIYPILAAALHETVWLALPQDMGVVVPDASEILDQRLAEHRALLIGPGLSQEPEAVKFVQTFLLGGRAARRGRGRIGFLAQAEPAEEPSGERPSLPATVIDADGLNALAKTDDWWQYLPHRCVLTPHPGEMARLCGLSTREINADRIGVAVRFAKEWEQIVLLKGAYTVIASPEGRAWVLPFANPGLATGGTGDVLAGAIVGLLAQGLEPFDAAVLGGYLHGLAGELARRRLGEAGMVAGDLISCLPEAVQLLHG